MGLREEFISYCRNDPRAPAVRVATTGSAATISREALFEGAAAIAAHLHFAGVRKGDKVLIALQTTAAFSLWFWGTQLLGAVAVPIEPFISPRRKSSQLRYLRILFELTHAKVLVTCTNGTVTGIDVPELQVLNADDPLETTAATWSCLPETTMDPQDYAVIQFSSGSTGQPGGCMLTHRAMSTNARTWVATFGYRAGESTFNWMPLFHDFGLMMGVIAPVFGGMTSILLRTEAFVSSPAAWLRGLSGVGPVHTAGPPSALSLVRSRLATRPAQPFALQDVRSLICAAEPIYPRVVEEFFELTKPFGFDPEAFHAAYGMSETTVLACGRKGLSIDYVMDGSREVGSTATPAAGASGSTSFVSVGGAPTGSEFRIVDDKGRRLAERRIGHIELRTPSLMDGYISDFERTHTALRGEWLSTGDIGYLVEGELHFVARSKDLIVVAGRKLVPSDIDDAVGERLGIPVTRVASCGISNGATEAVAIAIESRSAEMEAIRQAARGACFDRTGVLPARVIVCPIGSIPKTSSGKIRRGVLRTSLEGATASVCAESLAAL
jgi:acyl-CoA synthetase (AMP-forming)/AMP-acid ligase II